MRRDPLPMTPEGIRLLREELKKLKAVERPKIVAEIEAARGHGDLAENAEYDAAKERQGLLQKKIMEVEDRLARAQVIDPASLDHSKVVFGSTVTLAEQQSGEKIQYQIVGAHEADVKRSQISIESPLAKSLIGKSCGDLIQVTTPRGTREFKILEIS